MRTLSRSLITVVVAIVIGGIAVGACLAALIPGTVEVATAHHYTAPQVKELKALAQPSQIYWADGTPMGDPIGLENRQNINTIDEVPKMVQDAVIATEDRSFWTNDGIDLGGVFRAFLTNITSGKIEQGGSTITQQLVKNRILTSKRDVNRKIKEIEDALRLNEKFSKEKIFVEYLNTVYFGSGSYGIKSAAARFFNKPLDALTVGEAALLAGVISNPTGYNPYSNPDRAIRRRADVLRGMVDAGYLTQAQSDAANNEPIPTVPPPANPIVGTDFLSTEVLQDLLKTPALGATEKERSDKILQGWSEDLHHVRPRTAGPGGRRLEQRQARDGSRLGVVDRVDRSQHRCGEGDGVRPGLRRGEDQHRHLARRPADRIDVQGHHAGCRAHERLLARGRRVR